MDVRAPAAKVQRPPIIVVTDEKGKVIDMSQPRSSKPKAKAIVPTVVVITDSSESETSPFKSPVRPSLRTAERSKPRQKPAQSE